WIGGAHGGVERSAGPRGSLEFRQQFVRRRLAIAAEEIGERRAGPLAAGQRARIAFARKPGNEVTEKADHVSGVQRLGLFQSFSRDALAERVGSTRSASASRLNGVRSRAMNRASKHAIK